MADTLRILVPSDKQPLLTFKVARKCCQWEEFRDVKRISRTAYTKPAFPQSAQAGLRTVELRYHSQKLLRS